MNKRSKKTDLLPITREMAIGQWAFDLFGATDTAHWHDEITPPPPPQEIVDRLGRKTTVTFGEGHSSSWFPSAKACPTCSPKTAKAELKKLWGKPWKARWTRASKTDGSDDRT